jgi:hypothetical protein
MFILIYACSKLRHYLSSSTCVVAYQTDVIKHILQHPILSGRIKMWVYALIEYDLTYELLKFMKGQVVAYFIVGYSIDPNKDELFSLGLTRPWKLFFNGLARREGQGIGVVLILYRGAIFETMTRLEYFCTNNQVEYDVILLRLQILSSMCV